MAHGSRRKVLARLFVKIVLALFLADLAAYYALERGLANMLRATEHQFNLTRRAWRAEQGRVRSLEERAAALPEAEAQVQTFVKKHMPPRRRGFSQAARLVRQVSERSEVELSGLSYNLEENPQGPFERLTLRVIVEGPFPSLLNFAHNMETTTDFVLLRGFTVEQGDEGVLGLHLTADLYLMR